MVAVARPAAGLTHRAARQDPRRGWFARLGRPGGPLVSTGRCLLGAEGVIDRLLLALAAQVGAWRDPALAAGAVEALADSSRAEVDLIFGQAGHLAHYGADTEPLQTLMRLISAVQRAEAAGGAAVRPGDEVRLVGEVPENLAGYDETRLRETVFVVRYVGSDAIVAVQPDLTEDYVIATVPAACVELVRR